MDFLKKNKLIVGAVAVVVLAVVGIGFLLAGSGGQQNNVDSGDQAQEIKEISPDEIGLELSLREDGQAVVMRITKLEGIKGIEYEISYDSEEEVEGEVTSVPDGVIGSVEDIEGESEIEREIYLGTCSATCRPDKVLSDVHVLLKVTFENGEVGAVEDTVPLEAEAEEE